MSTKDCRPGEKATDLYMVNEKLNAEIAERERVENLLRESEARLQAIVDLVPCGIMLIDAQNHEIKEVNQLAREMFGAPLEEILGRECHQYVCPAQKGACPITDLNQRVDREERTLIKKSGENLDILKSAARITIGGRDYLLESFIDISERKKADELLKFYSIRDQLTGLYNRNYYEETLRRLRDEPCISVGIVICDLDGLKIINDTMGHHQGDELLRSTSRVLKDAFPSDSVIARIGGDEFAIVLSPCSRQVVEQGCAAVEKAAALSNEISDVQMSLSIGFAIGNTDVDDIQNIFKQADDNMYRNKLIHKKNSNDALVQNLKSALGDRDFITSGHADRMQKMVENIARRLGMSERSIEDLSLLAQFHDIGKIGISDALLFKSEPLSDEEKLIMQKHCEIGHRISQSASVLAEIGDLILKHHEWWNGEGYPFGLQGEEIPLECRILAVADAFDAMTSDRPYRKAMTVDAAIGELKKCSGSQFDPDIVDYFVNYIQNQGLADIN